MKNIIIADDSALARSFIIKCIEIAGIEDAQFHEAEDGSKVLELIENNIPDLILTDLNMPNVDGIDLVEKIKGNSEWADIPIVLITSAGNTEEREQLLSMGVKEILSKPLTPTKIIPILTSIFSDDEEPSYG